VDRGYVGRCSRDLKRGQKRVGGMKKKKERLGIKVHGLNRVGCRMGGRLLGWRREKGPCFFGGVVPQRGGSWDRPSKIVEGEFEGSSRWGAGEVFKWGLLRGEPRPKKEVAHKGAVPENERGGKIPMKQRAGWWGESTRKERRRNQKNKGAPQIKNKHRTSQTGISGTRKTTGKGFSVGVGVWFLGCMRKKGRKREASKPATIPE